MSKITKEDFRKKVEEIKKLNPNPQQDMCYHMTINDFAFITSFINQQPILDSDIEEALEELSKAYFIEGSNKFVVKGQRPFDTIYTHILLQQQAFIDKDNEITLLKRDLDTRNTMRKLTVGKLQAKLDKVEEVIEENILISMLNEEDIHYSDIREIHTILKEENN